MGSAPRVSAGVSRRIFTPAVPNESMDETDYLGLVLGGLAFLMFATGLLLVLQ